MFIVTHEISHRFPLDRSEEKEYNETETAGITAQHPLPRPCRNVPENALRKGDLP